MLDMAQTAKPHPLPVSGLLGPVRISLSKGRR